MSSKQKKIEIAYLTFGRDGRLLWKSKTVSEAKLEATIEKLSEQGAREIRVRESD